MIYFIWLLFLVLGLIGFFLAFKGKEDYPVESHLIMIIGSFFILMSGLFVLSLGVDYPNGFNESYSYMCGSCFESRSFINTSGNLTVLASTVREDNYSSLKGGLEGSYGLSWALILLSLGLFLSTALSWFDYRNSTSNRTYSEEED